MFLQANLRFQCPIPSGCQAEKEKAILTMHLIFHLININTLRDVKGEIRLVSCWQTETHRCQSHPGSGGRVIPPVDGYCSWLGDWQNTVPFLLWLQIWENLAFLQTRLTYLPSKCRSFLWFFTPKKPGSEAVKRQGHPSFCPGIEAALYQLSTTMDSPSSLFTKW